MNAKKADRSSEGCDVTAAMTSTDWRPSITTRCGPSDWARRTSSSKCYFASVSIQDGV